MRIESISQFQQPIQPMRAMRGGGSEEAGEAASGPAEEAAEGTSFAKSAELSVGLGAKIDTFA